MNQFLALNFVLVNLQLVNSFQPALIPSSFRKTFVPSIPKATSFSELRLSSRTSRSKSDLPCRLGVSSETDLNDRIARFYDDRYGDNIFTTDFHCFAFSSALWEEIWGEHMHMGHYGQDGQEKKSDTQAQIDMIDRLLDWGIGDGSPPVNVLDVGCGVGGSSRHIARKFGSSVTGITLSPLQCEHAKQRSEREGLSDRTNFIVADALNLPFEDNSFDLVWSLESGEHMPDKARWLQECHRVLRPGGRLLVATWVHRDTLPPGATGSLAGHPANPRLTPSERRLLDKISRYYALPAWVEPADYRAAAAAAGFGGEALREADWSDAVGPFWPAVWRSALSWRGVRGLLASLRRGLALARGARAVLLMIRGFRQGLVRLGLFTCLK